MPGLKIAVARCFAVWKATANPIVTAIVETADVARLVPAVEEMIGTGVLATSDVETFRVESLAPSGF
jgi:hypothetical protein